MQPIFDHLGEHGVGRAALVYAVAAAAALGLVWGVVTALELSVLYVRLAAVLALLGLPMALGLAWALGKPKDPEGKGYVARE